MKAKISMFAMAVLAGMSMAATSVMYFDSTGYKKGDVPPFGDWFSYADTIGGSANVTKGKTAMEITEVVNKKSDESYAGVGFIWAKSGAAVDLSAYEGMGVCLTYTSTADFRMDFQQSNIKNSNFNGVIVPAQSTMETVLFPFADFAQEDWGQTSNVALDLSKQTGVNFSYKTAIASANVNTIKISAIAFGKSCVNHAPTLKTGVTSPATEDLIEGDTLKVAFKDIFVDEDGDDLNITATVTGYIEDLKGAKSYGLKDVAWIISKPNPKEDETGKATFTAKDASGKEVSYVVNISLTDRDNPPVAADDAYEAVEDSVLTVGSSKGLLANDKDADNDPFKMVTFTQPENGTVVVTLGTGAFTYTPNANFHGVDTFTYTISDTAGVETSTATVTITVANVDDPATVTVNDSTIYVGDVVEEGAISLSAGIAVAEDFASFDLFVPVANVAFADPDVGGSSFPVSARSVKGLVNVEYAKIATNHVITVTAVPNANGSDVIQLFAVDGKDTVGVNIPVTIAAVADPPVAVADTFDVLQDSLNFIPAKTGLLANDLNPDGKSALTAVLATEAKHGKVTVDTTGAFTYEVGDYEGEDSFTYVVRNAEGEESAAATVVLNVGYKNKAPAILAGVADTVGARVTALKEDFSGSVEYRAAEVVSWFKDPEGDKITYSISNPDSMLAITINSSNAIFIRKVQNACGETFFGVVATDAKGASTTLKIPVGIACVNDAPMRIGGANDTIFVTPNGWRKAWSVFDLFEDPDDTTLTMKTSSVDRFLNPVIEGDSLIVTLADETQYLQNHVLYIMKVSATDAAGVQTVAPKTLTFMVGAGMDGISQIATASKLGWQGAIASERGMATIFDMQGRVMWKHALPVSEAQVRNAAARVQGRKILQVNKQTWTIK